MNAVLPLVSPAAMKKRKVKYDELKRYKSCVTDVRNEVQRSLDDFVRQNTSHLTDAILLEEHIEFVDLVPAERPIYRQAFHDNAIFDLQTGYESASLQALHPF